MRRLAALILGLLLTLALALPVAAAPEAAGATAMVADETGRAIAGAEVEVYQLGKGLVWTRRTDQMGTVRIPGPIPRASLWQLRVSARGYRTVETGWRDLTRTPYQFLRLDRLLGDLNVAVMDHDGKPVEGRVTLVGPGGQVAGEWKAKGGVVFQQGLLAGEYQLLVTARGYGADSRKVTLTGERMANAVVMLERAAQVLSGEVRDQVTGLPVQGARVVWLREDGATVMDGGTTDSQGRFRMGVAQGVSGRFQVLVRAPGYRLAVTAPVALTAGQNASWSGDSAIRLTPATGAIGGTVLRDDGLPKADVKVVLEARGYGYVAETTSAQDGSFQFAQIPADGDVEYRVQIDYTLQTAQSEWLPLKPGVTERVVLKMAQPSNTTFGKGSVSAFVTSAAGVPLAGANVELLRRNAVVMTAVTDAAGIYTFRDVPGSGAPWSGGQTAPYTVRISKDGFVTTGEVTVAGQTAHEFHLYAESRVEFRVALLPDKVDLQGRVTNAEGRPVAAAEVSLLNGAEQAAPMTTSTGEGWFSFRGVRSAPILPFELAAKADGYLPAAGVAAVAKPGREQALPALRMSPAAITFMGQVLGPGGQTVTGARVTVRDAGGEELTTGETDGMGLYRLKVPAMALPVTVEAERDGWSRGLAEVAEAPDSGVVNRDLVVLPQTAGASGRVLDAAGNPVASMRVELLEDGRGIVAATRTDADGVYRFEEVLLDGPGLFWLRVDTPVGTFAGSLRHGTELVPLMRLMPGQMVVTDLLVR